MRQTPAGLGELKGTLQWPQCWHRDAGRQGCCVPARRMPARSAMPTVPVPQGLQIPGAQGKELAESRIFSQVQQADREGGGQDGGGQGGPKQIIKTKSQ